MLCLAGYVRDPTRLGEEEDPLQTSQLASLFSDADPTEWNPGIQQRLHNGTHTNTGLVEDCPREFLQLTQTRVSIHTTQSEKIYENKKKFRNTLLQYTATMSCGNKDIIARTLVDSGASKDFISHSIASKLGATFRPLKHGFSVALANENTIQCNKTVRIPITIGGYREKREFHVLNMPNLQVVLGRPWLYDKNPNVNWRSNTLSFDDDHGYTHVWHPGDAHHCLETPTCNRMGHEELVEQLNSGEITRGPYLLKIKGLGENEEVNTPDGCLTFTTSHEGDRIAVLVEPVHQLAPLKTNTSDTEDSKKSNKELSAFEQLFQAEMDAKKGKHFAPAHHKRLKEYMDKHPEVYTDGGVKERDRLVDGIKVYHTIKTDSSKPIPCKSHYRLSKPELIECKKQIDDMLEKGWLRPSQSAYGAPIMFVPKPDKTYRMVLDYRDLNAITVKDRYPLPRDVDCFDQLQSAKIFTTIDLMYGYYQTLMHPDDVHKTAIRTPLGSYEFIVMPMGLTNAPATFQRMMEAVLRPFRTKFCMVYLDDIIIYSKTAEEHMEHILLVLEALRSHNLKIKLKKCDFFKTRIKFLGHIIESHEDSDTTIGPDPEKVTAISQWSQPVNNTQLQSFVGAVNYYNKMIENYAKIAAPLTSIMAKKWNSHTKNEYWTDKCTEAFEELKVALTKAPVLTLADLDKPFILQTDASLHAIGGVLMQLQPNNERTVVEFFSKKFSETEKRWPTHERELFGLVYALRKYKHYLQGTEVTYEGDHKPLTWIKTQRHLSMKQARWLETLESFDWTFKYVPGKDLVVPDAISRQPNLLQYLMVMAPAQLRRDANEQPYLVQTMQSIRDGVQETDIEPRWEQLA